MTALAGLLAAGCGTAGAARDEPLRVIVVRHAEKADDGSADPALSPQGMARARALADQLASTPLAAVYATPLRRARQTAAPVAQRHGVAVRTYPADMAAAALAVQLRAHRTGTVLVVGHSNTVPALASALCACPVAAIGDGTYGGRYDLRFG
ncbi:MAG TPA: phosphoglycerate mutase family protein, partial [Luteimonas sp.]|nr:phosphoglycerate mutase family protein [Luteimonas sp.]